jgi:multidrug transporter EmrE-like cation transporter
VTPQALFFILCSTFFGISSQLTLKYGMGKVAKQQEGSLLVKMLKSPYVMGGLAAYGTGVLFWLLALSRLELSYAYPFAILSYVGIIIGSYFFFKERISTMRLFGIVVILSGVLLIGFAGN